MLQSECDVTRFSYRITQRSERGCLITGTLSAGPQPVALSAYEYATLSRPELHYAVHGLIPIPGNTLLFGEPKSRKSFFALQVAIHVAQGRPLWGLRTYQAPVLYLQFDTPEPIWRKRLNNLIAQGIVLPPNLYLIHPDCAPVHVNILEERTRRVIRDAITQTDPGLVVLDVLREIHGKKEESSTDMRQVIDELLALTAGRGLILVHHTKKISNMENLRIVDLPRGTSYLAGKCDVLVALVDGEMYVTGRLDVNGNFEGGCERTGFWRFPTLQYKDQLDNGCVNHPGLSHKEVATALLKECPGLQHRAAVEYLERLDWCPHKDGGG